jgi:hypothetical protein
MSDEPKVVISLTTVPERLECDNIKGVPSVIHALCKLEYSNYEIHFNIPHIHKVKNKEYKIPYWLDNLQKKFEHLKVFRTEDFGPPTKIIPTLQRVEDPDTIIIVLDDDFVYDRKTIQEHVRYQSLYKKAVIGYDGLGSVIPKFYNGRDHFVVLVDEVTEVDIIQHYRTVSYKRSYFEQDFFDIFVGKTLSDDVLTSFYIRYKEIPLLVVPTPDNIPAKTEEEFQEKSAVLHFPCVTRSYAPDRTGTQDPEALKVQPRFFIPKELEDLVINKSSGFCDIELHELGIKNDADKALTRLYTLSYGKYFRNNKNHIERVCEIGIHNGGSLKMWRDFFKNAKIYGFDINPSPLVDEDRIFTSTIDPVNRNDIELFLDLNNICDFDLVVDNGSHTMKDQQSTLGSLFKFLKPGGIFIIEDLHTSMDIHGDRFGYQSSSISTHDMLKKFIEEGKIESEYITSEEKEFLSSNISSIDIIVPEGRNIYESCTSVIVKK